MALDIATAFFKGQAQLDELNFQQAIARNNAIIAEQNAERAITEGQVAAQDADIRASGQLGALIAKGSASGFALGSGSAAASERSLRTLAARDRERLTFAGRVEATNLRNEAANFRAEVQAAKRAKKFAKISGGLNLATTLIGQATSSGKIIA